MSVVSPVSETGCANARRQAFLSQLDLLGPLKNSSNLGAGCKWHYVLARNAGRTCAKLAPFSMHGFGNYAWGFAGGLCCCKAWLLVWAAGGFCCWQACRQYYILMLHYMISFICLTRLAR